MNSSDINRWNLKHKKAADIPPGSAESELVQAISTMPDRGRALDLACGSGKDSIYLAQAGFDVIAVDGSIEGLRRCSRAAEQASVQISPLLADLADYQIAANSFELIIMVRYLQRNLFQAIIDGLKNGGHVFIKTFDARYLQHNPKFNPDYVLAKNELNLAFSSLTMIDQGSDDHQTSSYIFARKPFP